MTDEAPEADADWARQQLVAIDDQLRAVARDDFARRHALQAAADTFRTILRNGHADELAAARAEWHARAGHKGEHQVDIEALEGFASTIGMFGDRA
jgi:hypothetical protein